MGFSLLPPCLWPSLLFEILPTLDPFSFRLGQVLPGPRPPTEVPSNTEFLGREPWPQPYSTESYHSEGELRAGAEYPSNESGGSGTSGGKGGFLVGKELLGVVSVPDALTKTLFSISSNTDGAGLCPILAGGDSRAAGSHSVPGVERGVPIFHLTSLFFLSPLK